MASFNLADDGHALICGASRGIGRAAALAIAEMGVHVTVLARSGEKLAALDPILRRHGARGVSVVVADLDDRPTMIQRVSQVIVDVGPIHVLVNNAGGPPTGDLLRATEETFVNAFGRHVMSAHQLTGLVLPGMREAHYGRIINVISTSVREPLAMLGVSNTIRGAMAAWAKSLANELPPMVTVNNLLPGFTRTERLDEIAEVAAVEAGVTSDEIRRRWCTTIPEGRLGRAEEQAQAIRFLASPEAAYMRGVSLHVDGGRMRSI